MYDVLERRAEENRGWSGAWKICLRARLGDGDRAESLLHRMVTDVSIHPRPEDSKDVPSFEGNQGIQAVTAGMAEMLLQSHEGVIRLLPALPKVWASGKVEGLRARGGFVVSLAWKNGALTSVKVRSNQGGLYKLVYADRTVILQTRAGQDYFRNGNLEVDGVR